MEYLYKKSNDLSLISGTSKLLNISDDFSGDEMTQIFGQLISRFGEPIYITPNLENAYCYVIIATDRDNRQYILNVYSGSTGPAIGGNYSDGTLNAAYALKKYIRDSGMTDYEYEGYYLDGPAKIVQRIKDGAVFYEEIEITDNEYKNALKLCYPNRI